MTLKLLHLQNNIRRQYVLYLYRKTLKETANFKDMMASSFFLKQLKQSYRKKLKVFDPDKIFLSIKLGEKFLENMITANKDNSSVELKRLLRIAYNQSSVYIRKDYEFVMMSKHRNYGIGISLFEKTGDYQQKRLLQYIMERTINKKYKDYVDEETMIKYLSEKRENTNDEGVLRPIPLRYEQNIYEMIKYSDIKLKSVYHEIFKIPQFMLPIFACDLQTKPEHVRFWKMTKAKNVKDYQVTSYPNTISS